MEPGKKIAAHICVADAAVLGAFKKESAAFALLARADGGQLSFASEMGPLNAEGKNVHLVVADGVEIFLPLAGLVDFAQERMRLEKQAEKLAASIDKLETRLNAPGFADKAPPAVVDQARTELREQQEQLATVKKSIQDLPQ